VKARFLMRRTQQEVTGPWKELGIVMFFHTILASVYIMFRNRLFETRILTIDGRARGPDRNTKNSRRSCGSSTTRRSGNGYNHGSLPILSQDFRFCVGMSCISIGCGGRKGEGPL
jgi:hypothetical protein